MTTMSIRSAGEDVPHAGRTLAHPLAAREARGHHARPMTWLPESGCVAVLALYAFLHRRERGWIAEAGLIAAGAWLGEDCIRLYRFYRPVDPRGTSGSTGSRCSSW